MKHLGTIGEVLLVCSIIYLSSVTLYKYAYSIGLKSGYNNYLEDNRVVAPTPLSAFEAFKALKDTNNHVIRCTEQYLDTRKAKIRATNARPIFYLGLSGSEE